MGLIHFILSLNSASVPSVPEPPEEGILWGDVEALWGDQIITFSD